MIEPARYLTAKMGTLALAVAAALVIMGCKTSHSNHSQVADSTQPSITSTNASTNLTDQSIILREGDGIKITFPGAPNLNTMPQPILRDGTISLPLIGNVKVAGKTAAQVREDLLKLYADKIESKEVLVEVTSALFPVFVQGAVLRPAKVMSDHPMTALEAISECGGFDFTKANLKHVRVLRQDGTRVKTYDLNLKAQMDNGVEQFYLQPGDIIFVKEKFTWF